MKRLLTLALVLLVPVSVLAASPIDGTWKLEPEHATLSAKPYEYLLKDGVFHCYSCVPPLTTPADGKEHPVKGDPDVDAATIHVVDQHRVDKIFVKGGQKLASSSFTVSTDGKTAVGEYTSYVGVGTAGPVKTAFEYVRLKPAPAGAHAHSGSWRQTRITSASDATMVVTLKLEGTALKMTSPLGQSYSAPVDGTEVPYVGDPYTDTVSVKRIDARTFEETDKRAGKVTGVSRMTVGADGKTLTSKYHDLVSGRDFEQVMTKQ